MENLDGGKPFYLVAAKHHGTSVQWGPRFVYESGSFARHDMRYCNCRQILTMQCIATERGES